MALIYWPFFFHNQLTLTILGGCLDYIITDVIHSDIDDCVIQYTNLFITKSSV